MSVLPLCSGIVLPWHEAVPITSRTFWAIVEAVTPCRRVRAVRCGISTWGKKLESPVRSFGADELNAASLMETTISNPIIPELPGPVRKK